MKFQNVQCEHGALSEKIIKCSKKDNISTMQNYEGFVKFNIFV
jgi:hypothetical protein